MGNCMTPEDKGASASDMKAVGANVISRTDS